MLSKILSKIKQYWWVNVLLILLVIFASGLAITYPRRQALINKYDRGVELYNEKRYEEALSIFSTMLDWGNPFVGDRNGQMMFNKTLEKIKEIEIKHYCPECGNVIIEYIPLEERP